jgi:class 3 adenylate cyclase/tetratricopeptide (TPR) repeat protein
MSSLSQKATLSRFPHSATPRWGSAIPARGDCTARDVSPAVSALAPAHTPALKSSIPSGPIAAKNLEARYNPGDVCRHTQRASAMTPPEQPPVPSPNPERAERKLATVLFADLVGSTELGGTQDPERTRMMLERFYDAVADEISRAGGTVEKFAGDAVMAAFGVPVAQEDHVERALHAGLAIRRRLDELFGGALSLRIGINTGEVVVGRARQQSSFVSGDAVNVAARLEQAAEPDEILVGERSAALVAGAFEFDASMRVEAKGKAEGVECRRLVRALSLMRPRGVPGLRPAFVGRDDELGRLRQAYDRARATGQAQAATIMGEAGVGKTRLLRELWEWCGREAPEAMRRTGRCAPYGLARTYQPLAEIVREHFGILGGDRPERILALLGQRKILALALGLDVAGDLHPIEARDRLHEGWIELIREVAAEQPVVLLVEDVHWAEEPLLELLERMLLDVRAPVLLLVTARPEFLDRSPTWGRWRVPSEWIWLEPLASADVDRWLEEIVPTEAPAPVREVLGRAEGNPLFLEELLGTLIERGVLRGNRWDEGLVPGETAVPETVQAVLASRIDLLPPREKAALYAAAVIGRAFWASAVRELLGGAEPDFRLLEQRDFVRRRPGSSLEGEREFIFKHALTREVACGSLTTRERALLHAGFAGWLERRGSERDEDALILADHYAQAVRPEDVDLVWSDEPDRRAELRASAVRWLRRAAELAAARFEIEDALALLDRALELESEAQSKIEILWEIARVHTFRYDAEGFRAALEEALALEPEAVVAADIYAQLAYYSLGRPYMWREPPPRELAEKWLARALELSQPETPARAWALLAQAVSDQSGREETAKEVHRLGEALEDPRLVVFAYETQALAATEAGRFQEACDWVDRALATSPRLGNPNYASFQFWNAGFVYMRAGRFAEARRFAQRFDELASSLTAHDEVHAVGLRALVEGVLGEWEAVANLAARAEAASAANEDFPCQFNWRTLLICALGLAHLGHEGEARRLEGVGRASAVVAGPAELEPALLRLALLRADKEATRQILGVLPGMGGPFGVDDAAARLDALLSLGETARLEEAAAPFLEEEGYTRPFALRALGISRGDGSLVDEAVARFEAMGLAWRALETRALARSAAIR